MTKILMISYFSSHHQNCNPCISSSLIPFPTDTTGNSYFAVCHGGRQRLERRTAKGSGKVGYGKQVLCRLLFMADGKESFAYSGGRQRGGTAKILDVRQR